MYISLDFDNTYTRDPATWDQFVDLMQKAGHTVYCVTMRYPTEGDDVLATLGKKVKVFFTSRKNKHDFMFAQGINIDVWIDDMPYFILNDARS